MRRKVIFRGTALPLLLLAPQLAVTAVFFLWPAGVAVYQSVLQQDPWGLRTEFVGLRNFAEVLADPDWRTAAWNTAVFSTAVAGLAMGIALLLAVQADKSIRGARAYRTLLIWPYAVAPAVAAVLWLFLFHPSIGLIGRALNANGVPWDPRLNGNQAMLLVIGAAAWKEVSYNFIFFLAGLQAIPRSVLEAAAIDGARPVQALLDGGVPLALADHLLPAGGEPRLRLLRHLRHHPRAHRRRPGQGDRDPDLQGLCGRRAEHRTWAPPPRNR